MDTCDEFKTITNHITIIAKELLTTFFGERCIDYDENCECCKRWHALDVLIENPFDKPKDNSNG